MILAAAGACGSAFAEKEKAARTCDLPKMNAGDRPNSGGGATKVAVGIFLLDLTRIDDIGQQITADFLVFQTWKDPRLRGLDGCRFGLEQIWSPTLAFLNSGRVFPGLPARATVGADGTMRYVQRHQGSLSFPHRLDEFPFDKHAIGITMVPTGQPADKVALTVDKKNSGRRETLSIPDWTLGDPVGVSGEMKHPLTAGTLSQIYFSITAERLYQYYLWKILMPLMLIVAMSWSVFWINPAKFGPQIGMSATSMLTLIAFQFAMASILPRLSYFTLLDAFITASTVLVFAALLVSLTTSYLVSIERTETALRIDRTCRWAFPLTFFVVVVAIFIV